MKLITKWLTFEEIETEIQPEIAEEIISLAREVCDHIQALRKRFRFGWWTRKEWWPRGSIMLCRRYVKDKQSIEVHVRRAYPTSTNYNFLCVDGYVNGRHVSDHSIFFTGKGTEKILDAHQGNSLLTVEDIAAILRTLKPYLEEIAAKQ